MNLIIGSLIIAFITSGVLGSIYGISESKKLNEKANELTEKVKLLTLIAHIECDLPEWYDNPGYKISCLEKNIRDLEFYLLNRSYQEKDKKDTQE